VYYSEQDESAAEQLAVQIYRGLRECGLPADPVVELACLIGEHDLSCPAVREILERRTAELTPEEVARLGQDLLTEMSFEPGFDLEPGLWTTLETAVKMVERDVRASGIEAVLGIAIPGWDRDSGCARVEFRGGCGGPAIWPRSGRDGNVALADIADAVQDIVMEHIWGVWPVCPEHGLGVHAALVEGTAVWQCAGAGTHTAAAIGDLSPSSRQRRPYWSERKDA
jgi:hypothetical protein